MRSFLILLASALTCCAQLTLDGPQAAVFAQQQAASGGFAYHATYMDTGSYVTHSGALTGIANSKTFTVSLWVKLLSADNADCELFSIAAPSGGAGLQIQRGTDGYLHVLGYNSAGTLILNASDYPAQFLLSSNWTHIFVSVDLNAGAVNIYQNGSESHNINSIANDTINLTSGVNGYCGWLNNFFGNIRVSEVWFDTNYTASPAAWRSGTHPADLGANGSTPTGSQPKVYFHDAYSTFQSNLGTGGDYTLVGTLQDSDSDKP